MEILSLYVGFHFPIGIIDGVSAGACVSLGQVTLLGSVLIGVSCGGGHQKEKAGTAGCRLGFGLVYDCLYLRLRPGCHPLRLTLGVRYWRPRSLASLSVCARLALICSRVIFIMSPCGLVPVSLVGGTGGVGLL